MEPIFLNDRIEIPPTPEGPGDDGNGVFSFIYRGEEVREIEEKYGRINCCLKIFKNKEPFKEDLEKVWWGHSARARGTLMPEAVHIQNICAMEGLAPRVYAVFQVQIRNEKYWAHLTDDLGHWTPNSSYTTLTGGTSSTTDVIQNDLITGPLVVLGEKYGFDVFNDGREHNVVGGKYVDFQGFHLKEDYPVRLKERVYGIANVGKWGPFMNYHSFPELGITGGRNNENRIKEMKLDEIDFTGKTVLDIGCSEGFFCQYAAKRGAKRVVGIDLPGIEKRSFELASYMGYWNIDFYGYDLKVESPVVLGKFDIVFYFSMGLHIGYPSWVSTIVHETLVFEGNGRSEDNLCIERIKTDFPMYKFIGNTTDLFERPVFQGRKL